MKYPALFYAACLLLLTSCFNNENGFHDEGLITGPDYRLCACCGGWFVEIDTTTYLFWELPEESNIDLTTESFPVPVKLDWKPVEESCIANRIVISRIKKTD